MRFCDGLALLLWRLLLLLLVVMVTVVGTSKVGREGVRCGTCGDGMAVTMAAVASDGRSGSLLGST